MCRYIGIDPGAKGAVCLLDTTDKSILFHITDPLLVYDWIMEQHRLKPIKMIGVEDVHSLHRMSAKSNFTFGYNVGQIRLAAELTKIGVDLVTPKKWQQTVGVGSLAKVKGVTARKRVIGRVAARLYPHAALTGPKGGLLDGRCDALLIAHYMSLRYGG